MPRPMRCCWWWARARSPEALGKALGSALTGALKEGDLAYKAGRCLYLHGLSGVKASRVGLRGGRRAVGEGLPCRTGRRPGAAEGRRRAAPAGGLGAAAADRRSAGPAAGRRRERCPLRVPPHQAVGAGGVEAAARHAGLRRGAKPRPCAMACIAARPSPPAWRWRANAPTGPATIARRRTWPTRRGAWPRRTTWRSRCSNRKEVEKLGMGCFLAVAQGSDAAAEVHRAAVPRRGQDGGAAGAGGQGHHLRHRRHLDQAGGRDGRDEVRHGRRGQRAGHLPRGGAAQAEGQPGRPDPGLREHAQRHGRQAGRRGHQPVGTDDRDPQHRRRGPPDPVRRADLCRALQARGGGRHRHADRRLRGRARPSPQRPVQPRRRAGRPNWTRPARLRSTRAGACRWTTSTTKA